MKPIRLATIALVLGAVSSCSVYGQSPGYGPPQGPPPGYDYDRGYDSWPSPRDEVGFFYDELSPWGDWVMTRDYGWAWFPRYVRPYWRPYTDGRWVVTEYGWTWVSFEPFGWATYHYGRWAWDPRFGWLWVPGTIWAPAWVSWQHGGGYVGWAPLPPEVGYEMGFGMRLGGFDLSIGIQPDHYSFVPERSFLEVHVSKYLVPTARNVSIIRETTNITSYANDGDRVVNRGVDVRRIEQATGQRVQQRRVAAAPAKAPSAVERDEVRIYRPQRQQLEKVRVGPRVNAGLRPETPAAGTGAAKPPVERRDAPDRVVAPRAEQVPPTDEKQLEKQERREQQELARFQAEEQRKLDRIQRQETAKVRGQAERVQVEKRHGVEREALQQQQRKATQQLEARQKAKRQAAQAKPLVRNKR